MRVSTTFLVLLCSGLWAQVPSIQGVVNSASYQPQVAPGTWVAILGSQLAPSTLAASSTPFPTVLNGVSVAVAGKSAPLSFVSAGQINALIPFDSAGLLPGQTVAASVVVTTGTGLSATFTLTLRRNAPAFYTRDASGRGSVLAFDRNFKAISTIDGGPVVLYATGLGPASPDAVTGEVTPVGTLRKLQGTLAFSIGESLGEALFAGLAPGSTSPGLTLPVPQGLNVANVMGSIDGVYPRTASGESTTTSTISMLLNAASFSATFDLVPNAVPFQVVALAGDQKITFNVDPAAGTWTSSTPVPTAAERFYDFSGRPALQVYDYLAGSPFPGNIVPQSRVDPLARNALALIPLPNTSAGLYRSSGLIPADGHLVLEGTFGAFVNHSRAASRQSVTVPFSLYVDAKKVASNAAIVNFP